jgi:hypothetical protein
VRFYQLLFIIVLMIGYDDQISAAEEYSILVLPSGGATGIVPAMVLQNIEQRVGISLTEVIDEIWCSSVGAITTAAILEHNSDYAVQKLETKFGSYRSAYNARDVTDALTNPSLTLGQTPITVRILTAASKSGTSPWNAYDFSSDGTGKCADITVTLADAVKASCTVYPYLYRSPVKITTATTPLYAIDPGSLECEEPMVDPTPYFLLQQLKQLKQHKKTTLYFLGNAFTPSVDPEELVSICASTAGTYKIYDQENSFSGENDIQLSIVSIPMLISCEEIMERYLKNASFIERVTTKAIRAVFERTVGNQYALANMLAAAVLPVEELKKDATTIIKYSNNLQGMIRALKKKCMIMAHAAPPLHAARQ